MKELKEMTASKSVEPWGNLATASILIIGHDPCLMKSEAKAKYPFFFEHLDHPEPKYGPHRAQYGLAKAVTEYVNWLSNQLVPIEQLYVTNLCCNYLDRASKPGTILIPDSEARAGIAAIGQAIDKGHFKVILPMSVQVFFHFCQFKFIDEDTEMLKHFEEKARPREKKAEQGIYVSRGLAPFLQVCGKLFHHQGIPVVPILHIKQWRQGKVRIEKYKRPMEDARDQVRTALAMA